jgi:hypothetical protein
MKICNKCGSIEFYKSGHCKPCRKEYSANYRKLNPEKVKEAITRCLLINRKEYNKQKLSRYNENPEPQKLRSSIYRDKFPMRVSDVKSKWYIRNIEHNRAKRIKHYVENKHLWKYYTQNRRSRKLFSGGKLSTDLAEKLLLLQKGKCACCGKKLGIDYHLDHIMPLFLGGTNTDNNIQLLRSKCNLNKSTKHPIDFMQMRGFLL